MPDYEVMLKVVPAQPIASAREVVPTVEAMPAHCRALADAAYALARQRGLPVTGPCFAIYHVTGGYREEDIDTEMAAPVATSAAEAGPNSADGVARLRELPGVPAMAAVVHTGDYGTLMGAYLAVANWIEAHGYRYAGPCREIYLQGPEAGTPVTEIQFPVERA